MNSSYKTRIEKKRKQIKRSRTGCPQCRIRKIKCDETRPECQRCITRHLTCGYLDHLLEIPLIKHYELNIQSQFQTILISQILQIPTSSNKLSSSILGKFYDDTIIDATLLISYGLLLPQRSNLLSNFIQLQTNCINHIVEGINNLNDTNVLTILSISIALDLTVNSLPVEISFNQREKFINGPISILKTVIEQSYKFPSSFSILNQLLDICNTSNQ